jgi:uncharacterized membrane protein YhaH (DUF805 family)
VVNASIGVYSTWTSLDNREVSELEETQRPKAPRIGFCNAVKSGFQNVIVYDARSTRAEFWWLFLCFCLAVVALALILDIANVGDETFDDMYSLLGILSIPFNVSVLVRRLHDLNHSGWLILLIFVPVINFFWWLYVTLAPSKPEENRWRRLH